MKQSRYIVPAVQRGLLFDNDCDHTLALSPATTHLKEPP
jgi:hypothetical protein